jgi:hypothetical protein
MERQLVSSLSSVTPYGQSSRCSERARHAYRRANFLCSRQAGGSFGCAQRRVGIGERSGRGLQRRRYGGGRDRKET